WIGSTLGACLMFSLHGGRWVRGLTLAAAIALSAAGAYEAELYPAAIQQRIAETLKPTETSDLGARMQVGRDLAGSEEDSRGAGIGVGASENYLRDHHSTAQVVSIHNVVIHAAVEGGILAAASILMIPIGIAVLWRAASGTRDSTRAFLRDWQMSSLMAIY